MSDLPDAVLLPYQKAWIADESPLKIAEKSRRIGLTWAEAADAVLTASASQAAGGTNHFYVGSNKEMAIEFIDACAMWARAFNRAASEVQEEIIQDEDKDILTYTIHFTSGFKIQALSSRPRTCAAARATSPSTRPHSTSTWPRCSRPRWPSPCGAQRCV